VLKGKADHHLADKPALAGIYEIKEKLCALLRHKEQSKKACRRHILQLPRQVPSSRVSLTWMTLQP
jgi:hypothetical protein